MFCAPGRNRTYDLHICLSEVPVQGLLFYRLRQAAGTDLHPFSGLIGGTGNNWDEFTND